MRAGACIATVACCTAVVAGCAGDRAGSSGPTAPATARVTAPGAASQTPTEGSTVNPEVQRVVDAAVADLRSRPGTGSGPVRVVVAREETFPDGALGCPRPGMSYTQALVDGYRVVLARGGAEWLYTAGPDGVPRLCETGPDGASDSSPTG